MLCIFPPENTNCLEQVAIKIAYSKVRSTHKRIFKLSLPSVRFYEPPLQKNKVAKPFILALHVGDLLESSEVHVQAASFTIAEV